MDIYKKSVGKIKKAAGYIHPIPLKRGSTKIGRIVVDGEAAV